MPPQLQLIQQERRFYFIGRLSGEDSRPERASRAEGPFPSIIFSVQADSLEDARQRFRNSGHSDSDALFIIATETSIYLA